MKTSTFLLGLFILGSVLLDVCGSDYDDDDDSGSGVYDDHDDGDDQVIHSDDDGVFRGDNDDDYGDEDNDDDDDNNDDDEDDDDDDGDVDYEFHCDHLNLEICMNDYAKYESFDAPESDNPLCWESYTTMQCLHDYAKVCFEDSEMKEDYLCKIKYFQDRIQLLCLNETEEGGDYDDVEEALKCLEGAEIDAEVCVESAIPEVRTMLERNKLLPTAVNSLDKMKCFIMAHVLECTVDRLKSRCSEEAIKHFREGAEEALHEAMGGICNRQTIADFTLMK